MHQARERPDLPVSPDAWEKARRYGIDMSASSANLNRTVLERIRNRDRALSLALALRQAMADREGEFGHCPDSLSGD
jgi:hypothetical protein